MNITEVELERLRNPELYEYAEVDASNIRTLRTRNLQWVWIQEVLASLPPKKAIFVALPDGWHPSAFALRLRSMLTVAWANTRDARWSIRQSEKRDGVYVLKAAELPPLSSIAERREFWRAQLPNHPLPLSAKARRDAHRMVQEVAQ